MKLFVLATVVAALLASAISYDRLPSEIPIHWNSSGEVDDTMAKPWGPFFLPLMMLGAAALFLVLPRISPRGWDIDGKGRGFRAIVMSTLLFLLALHLGTLAFALGYPVSIPILVTMLAGLLFIILGNYLGKVQRNFFIGIRTPWTLADEDVWFRTHRIAGRLFVIAGIFILVAVPFAGERFAAALVVAGALTAALIPAIYSYVIYPKKGVTE
jgi:uncharacterized membrane protein